MPHSHLRPTLAAALAALALLANACATIDPQRHEFFGKVEPPAGQHLRYITGSEPESLDPQTSSGQPEARLYMALFEGLVEYHPKTMQPVPAVAERWVVDEDAAEFVFFLRRNARWSNGDPVTAHDFVYTFRRALSPSLASRTAYMAYDIKYGQAYNSGGSFVRDPSTGRFLTAAEAAPATAGTSVAVGLNPPPDVEKLHAEELARQGEQAAPDTEFHKYIHAPTRLVVPKDPAAREKAAKANPRLAALLEGKELVPVRAEDIGVEAVDDHTLRITLAQPAPYFVGLLAHQLFRPVPRKAIEAHGNALWTKPANIITNGPFRLKTHRPYNEIVVVKEPNYWDAATVRLESITFYPLEDQATMLNLYNTGEVDAIYNHSVPAPWLKAGVRQYKDYMDAPENANEYYQINTTKPPMNDARVRRAFSLALDRRALADYKVVVKPSTAFVPEGIFPGYPQPRPEGYNPERAKQLLAEAGFRDGAGNFDPKKFPVSEVEIVYSTAEANRQVAERVQAIWQQTLGLTIPLRNVEWKTFLKMRSNLEYKGFARSAWGGDYMDPYTFLGIFSTPSGDNGTGWFDPAYAALLKEANSTPDQTRRYQLLAEAEAKLLDAQPIIPMWTAATNWMKKPYVKGLYPNPGTLHPWKHVYIEHDRAKWDKGMPDMTPDVSAD